MRHRSIEGTLAPSTQTAPVRSRADAYNFLCSVGDIAETIASISRAISVKIRPGKMIHTSVPTGCGYPRYAKCNKIYDGKITAVFLLPT